MPIPETTNHTVHRACAYTELLDGEPYRVHGCAWTWKSVGVPYTSNCGTFQASAQAKGLAEMEKSYGQPTEMSRFLGASILVRNQRVRWLATILCREVCKWTIVLAIRLFGMHRLSYFSDESALSQTEEGAAKP
jgi:hypothetical protein